jgi:DNA invertase Pin-like site-specific DNA recombinase
MEFAAITQTLLIDADGIYDPGDINDRMLLGMKSTIGEVELHVMAQRLAASKKAAAERGELRTPLPVGYVHDPAGEVVIDPDAEVQAAIGDLFAAFAAGGSAMVWSPRSPTGGSRCALTVGPGPGSCAGANSPTPVCWEC